MKLKTFLIPLVLLIATVASASHRTYSYPEYGFSAVFPIRTSVEKDASDPDVVTFTHDDGTAMLTVTVYGFDYAKALAKVPDVKTLLERLMNANVSSDVVMDPGGISWSKDEAGHLRATASFVFTGTRKDGTTFRLHATHRLIAVPETQRFFELSFVISPADEAGPSDTSPSDFFGNFKLLP